MPCPNKIGDGRDHNPDCDLCDHGTLFFDPKEVPMYLSSANLEQQFYMFGHFETGSMLVTSLAENPISFGGSHYGQIKYHS